MAEESRGASRELQLETRHLAAIVVLIAFLCMASFMLGRWVERQAFRATVEGAAGLPGGKSSISVEDVNRELTYFKTLEGESESPGVKPAPPDAPLAPVKVQVPAETASAISETTPPDPAAARRPNRPAADSLPGVTIQVLATKDPAAAASLMKRLSARGYHVTASEERSAGVLWRKVRVGPYPSRAEAEKIARRLSSEEKVTTWIP